MDMKMGAGSLWLRRGRVGRRSGCQPLACSLLRSYFIMGKKLKKCPKSCTKHAFLLTPVHYSAVFSRELAASYCPSSVTAASVAPTFNTDARHFTPAFTLPAHSNLTSAHEQFYEREQARCKAGNERSEMVKLVAKPRGKEGYCSVCKDDYDEYLEHVEEESHKKCLRDSKFNAYIDEMVMQLGRQGELTETRQRKRASETFLSFSHFENTCEDLSAPHHDYLNLEEGLKLQQLFQTARNFQLLKDSVESVAVDMQEEASLFRRPSFHEKQTETIIAYGALLSPARSVVSVIINGGSQGYS